MENKRIIQGLILILIVSLTCAAIYAVETLKFHIQIHPMVKVAFTLADMGMLVM